MTGAEEVSSSSPARIPPSQQLQNGTYDLCSLIQTL